MSIILVNPNSPHRQIAQERSSLGLASGKAVFVVLLSMLGVACTASGDSQNGARSAASTIGWATTVPDPKPFVIASRGKTELNYVPIGRGGVERPVIQRNAAAVRDLETQLDRTRDGSENFARRQLPAGAYGRALPSVAAPPRPQAAAVRPSTGSPDSFPVNPNRLRQLRENSRRATDQ